MYEISDISKEYNSTPWIIPLSKRIKYIDDSMDNRKTAIIVYGKADTSTFRYRGYNIYQIMNRSSMWKVCYFFVDEIDKVDFLLNKTDLVIFSRVRWTERLQHFLDYAKMLRNRIAYDIDDEVFDLKKVSLLISTLGVPVDTDDGIYDYWFSYISRMDMLAKQADAYISTNSFLSDRLKGKYKKESYIIPNFINKEQVEISERLLKEKGEHTQKKPFVIGYFSGTPSHREDFAIVYNELISLMEKYEDISVWVVGFMEFPKNAKPYIEKKRIRFFELVDFIKLQEYIAKVDVNIVPLVENEFTNCKSELKFFEAAIVDTITCATPTYTYKKSIVDGKTGFLCSNEDWYSVLEKIYLKEFDVLGITKKAREYCMSEYFGEKIIKRIEKVYDSIVNV